MSALDYIDLSLLCVDPIEVTQAELLYLGATIIVVVNGDGKLVRFYNYYPVEAVCTGQIII